MVDDRAVKSEEQSKQGITVAGVLQKGLDEYCRRFGPLSNRECKVVGHMLSCHTPILGSQTYRCEACGDTIFFHNSCRDRHCPSCQATARAHWVSSRMEELLPVGYFHVVFTIPSQLNPLVLRNKELLYSLHFSAVSEVLSTLAADPKHHGGSIGVIAVLHTWGQNLLDHPHLHCVIPGGGIRDDGKKWKSFRENYLFPVSVMRPLFRRIYLEKLQDAFANGKLEFHGNVSYLADPQTWDLFCDGLRNLEWCVYAKKPFTTPEKVLKYLGGYTHRIAISNARLVSMDETHVFFKWKNYAANDRWSVMKLEIPEFIRRLLLHVLPEKFVRIRYFGFLSNQNRKSKLEKCRELLGQKHTSVVIPRTVPEFYARTMGVNIRRCRKCEEGEYKSVDTKGRYSALSRSRYREATLRACRPWPSVVQQRYVPPPTIKVGSGPPGK